MVLLGLALALSLVLGVGLAWARGAALITRPSWLTEGAAVPAVASLSASQPAVASSEAAAAAEPAGIRQAP